MEPGRLLSSRWRNSVKCYVVQSMTTSVQQAYWRGTGEAFVIDGGYLAFAEHKMSEYGNCQRCGYRPRVRQ